MAANTGTKTGPKTAGKSAEGFSAEERAAMKARGRELKASRGGKGDGKAEGEAVALAAYAAMSPADRALGERVHALIKAAAPELSAKTWYGMPAYGKDGNTICFFQNAGKFKARYSMLGFSDKAKLDDGNVWPVYYALKALTADDEAKITALVRRAVG